MSNANMSEIDKQINAAKAKQARQGKSTMVTEGDAKPKATRKRLTPEEREARDKAKAEERAQKKAEREAKRAAKKAEREANKQPAHMKKIQKIMDALPELPDEAEIFFNQVVANLNVDAADALVKHLDVFVRTERTKQALNRNVEAGQTVRIVSGPAKFIGCVGTVVKAQRIRCYVNVPGHDKDVYLFISDTEDCVNGELVQGSEEPTEAAAEA
jgi:hypothetical protein